jgi:hypothetical protein
MLNSSQNNFNIENETNDENIHIIYNQLINKLLIIKSVSKMLNNTEEAGK